MLLFSLGESELKGCEGLGGQFMGTERWRGTCFLKRVERGDTKGESNEINDQTDRGPSLWALNGRGALAV